MWSHGIRSASQMALDVVLRDHAVNVLVRNLICRKILMPPPRPRKSLSLELLMHSYAASCSYSIAARPWISEGTSSVMSVVCSRTSRSKHVLEYEYPCQKYSRHLTVYFQTAPSPVMQQATSDLVHSRRSSVFSWPPASPDHQEPAVAS